VSVLLDRVKDPGNLGTVIRTAAAFGCHRIDVTPKCADVWSSKVVRSAMGGHFFIKIGDKDVDKLDDVTSRFSHVIFADATRKQCVNNDLMLTLKINELSEQHLLNHAHIGVVVGNETMGIDQTIYQRFYQIKRATANTIHLYKLEIPVEFDIESLNCSVAFGIICSKLRELLIKQ
jgi:tRNA G18 (ribose-2'-O)-methylase SpoU